MLLSTRQDARGWALALGIRAGGLIVTGVSVLGVAMIFLFIVREAWPFFAGDNAGELLTSASWSPEASVASSNPRFGAMSLIVGSAYVTIGALAVAVPLGLTSAVFLSDIVSFRTRQFIKPMVEILAAIPSVAYGFFALLIVAPFLQEHMGFDTGTNALNAAMILGIMAVPTIVTVAEDALWVAGRELREGSYALGATRAETLIKVVIPAAHNGVIAAVILGMMRAIGETMVVWMAAGNAGQIPTPWWNLGAGVRTVTATIAGDMGETARGTTHYHSLFALGALLLTFTFVLNLLMEYFLSKLRGDYGSHTGSDTNKLTLVDRPMNLVRAIFRLATCLPRRLARTRAWKRFSQMRSELKWRRMCDKVFTLVSAGGVVMLAAGLFTVLGPMLFRGCGAVVFQGTVEWRRFVNEEFARGDEFALQQEYASSDEIRSQIWTIIDRCAWMSPTLIQDETRRICRQIRREHTAQQDEMKAAIAKLVTRKQQLVMQNASDDEVAALDARIERQNDELSRLIAHHQKVSGVGRDIGDILTGDTFREGAFQTTSVNLAISLLDEAIHHPDADLLDGTPGETMLQIAREYRRGLAGADLAARNKYRPHYEKALEHVQRLLGPRHTQNTHHLPPEVRYGATRWDIACKYLNDFSHETIWLSSDNNLSTPKVVRRVDRFKGTEMEELFELVEQNTSRLLRPRWTIYWRYFTDDSTPGRYLGGIGPEIQGTLLMTVIAVSIALVLGVISAGCLVEANPDNLLVKIIRVCVNTLAGVPSIILGLFGLAFFIIYLSMPVSILTGSLTLAILTLPIVIRASEESMRAVPGSYMEAAMALGAGRLRCFVTVTLPAALPGVLTGTILAMSRSAGETAPILFTAAVAMGPRTWNILHRTRTLSYSCYDMATGDRLGALAQHNQYGMVATLVGLVLVMNVAAIVLRGRIERSLTGQQ